MAEYIEREAILDYITKHKSKMIPSSDGKHSISIEAMEDVIQDFITADVTPVIHGHWIVGEFNGIGTPVWCSECGERTKNIVDLKAWIECPSHQYCGRCGAKMDGKDGEKDV